MEKINCAYDELVDLEKIIPNPKNNNKHPKEQIERLAKIIDFQGQRSPIVISNRSGFIVKGHGRLEAIKLLGWKQAAVDYQEYESEAQEYADMTADNQIATWAEFDTQALLDELPNLDIDLDMLGMVEIPEIETEESEVVEDEVPEQVETRCKRGDIWKLGNHRLMCGDSTSITDVEKLMNGQKADMVFTDPPYNVNATSRSKKNGIDKIKNDNISDNEFDNFIKETFKRCKENIKNNSGFYFWHNHHCQYIFEKNLVELGFVIRNQIIWVKDIPAYSNNLYRQQHEIAFYCYLDTDEIPQENGKDSTVWNIPSIQSAKSIDEKGNSWFKGGNKNLNLHVTQKPINLPIKAINFNTYKNNIVLDLFGGSGSTLIACEQLDRKCYMMELDEHYCDVIITRWENLTQQKAERIENENN